MRCGEGGGASGRGACVGAVWVGAGYVCVGADCAGHSSFFDGLPVCPARCVLTARDDFTCLLVFFVCVPPVRRNPRPSPREERRHARVPPPPHTHTGHTRKRRTGLARRACAPYAQQHLAPRRTRGVQRRQAVVAPPLRSLPLGGAVQCAATPASAPARFGLCASAMRLKPPRLCMLSGTEATTHEGAGPGTPFRSWSSPSCSIAARDAGGRGETL